MKVAMVTECFPPHWGGVEVHTYELSRELSKLGNEVHVFAPRLERISFTDKTEETEGMVIHRLSGLRLLKSSFSPYTAPKLKWYFKTEKFEVVHGQHIFTPLGFQALAASGLMYPRPSRIIGTNHSISRGKLERALYFFTKRQLKRVLNLADKLIAVSKASANLLFPLVPPEKIAVIPNGINTEIFSPYTPPSLKTEEKIVLACGRLVKAKGFDLLIRAAAELRDVQAKFVIVGTGKEREELLRLTKKLEVEERFLFLGSVPYERLPGVYASSYVVVIPSRKEAASRVVLEAMASGKPVIASKTGGIREFIEDGKWGLFFEPENYRDLAQKLLILLSDEKLALKMGRRGREEAEKYSWKNIAAKTLALYRDSP
jgi:glycosyltransferase involved in cell wall biosynthesis